VRKYLARRPLRKRLIALAAAYAIALSSLLASFVAASAAAEAAAIPGGIIFCHTVIDGRQAPAPAENGKLCVACCGPGCTMSLAALPPPPLVAAPLLQTASERVAPLHAAAFAGEHQDKSHRSRAPPLTA
jgi:hypothetical protein